jgi:hypothetical protein
MEQQARLLAAQMAAPKMVRVLYHDLRGPDAKLHAFDVLTQNTILLGGDAEWGDEGEILTEESSSLET